MPGLVEATPQGLFCAEGDFYIDPWQPVDRAIITHAHADHVVPGCRSYLTAAPGGAILRARLGSDAAIETRPYGDRFSIAHARVSLHSAGHMLGSSQIRVEASGEVWVVSGDYKVQADPTCTPIDIVPCHTFVTEATYGLPVYRWPPADAAMAGLHRWWAQNQADGLTSVVFAYALGKAQRVLAELRPDGVPILLHGGVVRYLDAYRASGLAMPAARYADDQLAKAGRGRALVLAPPSAAATPWLRKFAPYSTAFASGWMAIRGIRRRRSVDRGFVLSDHADWDGLMTVIRATGATRIGVTHGYTHVLTRWLTEQGLEAFVLPTQFEGERGELSEEKEASSD